MVKPFQELKQKINGFSSLVDAQEFCWCNPDLLPFAQAKAKENITLEEIEDAEERLVRFAPFLKKCFPETASSGGIIESELAETENLKEYLNRKYDANISGKLYLKLDSHLPIAGSVKARGGIYEVLKHTEELALAHGILREGDSYDVLADSRAKEFFSHYTVQVGSTGNLGLSIGIMSAAIGYRAMVHMSVDAKEWKKKLLRSHGVTVVEYASDYSEAVKQGRKQSDTDQNSYFVDDENSKTLFLGYAVAALRLKRQLEKLHVAVDEAHPLFVYLPCGVGGAPGGITYGLKQVFADAVHCFFVEPVQAPCMLLGMASGLHNKISVQDIGLTGITHADGLAVSRPSGFVGTVMQPLLSGIFTVSDSHLYEYLQNIFQTEGYFLEPSACAGLTGPIHLVKYPQTRKYLKDRGLVPALSQATHLVWATGGSLVPDSIREQYLHMDFSLL